MDDTSNPYRPPAESPRHEAGGPVGRGTPTAAVVLAILGLVYGGLGLACNPAAALGNLIVTEPPAGVDPLFRVAYEPGYRAGATAAAVAGFLACGLLFVGSIGLLLGRPWGRRLVLTYAGASLAATMAYLAFAAWWFLGAARAAAEAGGGGPEAVVRAVAFVAGGLGVGCSAAFVPVLALVLLNLPSVVAAYRGGTPPPEIVWTDEPGGRP